ncbi:MAG TPA: HAMP domain-containing sensor histidine kinase [Solirubrobacteraceae bacterium]|nr:HAMP domain-containing sensor histidine kinase [Solirubrobacteraceae bacterium]
MSLRGRIAAAASLSVALAVIAAAAGVYFAVRSDLRGGIDKFLTQRSHKIVTLAAAAPERALSTLDQLRALARGARAPGGFPPHLPSPRFGAPPGFIELIAPSGAAVVPGGQGASPALAPDASDRRIARSGRGSSFSDRLIKGTELRVLTVGIGSRGAVLIARPLTEVNDDLSSLLPLLALVAIGGIVLAALLGVLVARTALVPIARFTARTEELSDSLDLAQRLEIKGRDELARLAHSFNTTLDALERSIEAQRHLIADASHELRTPIASLHANIQVLREADRLSPSEQEGLRNDIEEELAELTSLVSDIVELARGSKRIDTLDELRLDQIVESVLERARRRSDVRFVVSLEPTLIRAQGQRIDRAISNLIDNACKWSPPQGPVEVALIGGVLSVRDHGPGFAEHDLPFVFDRFYRADRARNLPGSGLGLAIVRQVAESHDGYAHAANAPGGGAVLYVSFGAPIEIGAPAARSPSPA